MQLDPAKRVPEWEEMAAVAASVQNLWIAASAHGIGGYWSTPDLIQHLGDIVPMNNGEKCIGLFYMGHYAPFETNRKRGPITQKLTWIE
jgi:nitroreductase